MPDTLRARDRPPFGYAPVVLVLAVSQAFKVTAALVFIFFILFPVLAQGLIAFAAAQAIGERGENKEYERDHRVPGARAE